MDFQSTPNFLLIMKKYFKKDYYKNYFSVLASFAIGIYPSSLIAGERCSDMNKMYSEVEGGINSSKLNPPYERIWLIPRSGPGKINFEKTYNNLISKKIYQTSSRYTCTYNYGVPWIQGWGAPTFNKDVLIRYGKACIDNTNGLQFSGDNGDIIDKKGDMVALSDTVRVRKSYAFCKSNIIDFYTLSDADWIPSGSSRLQRNYFPFLLLRIVRYEGVMDNIYTIQSNPQF